jgi:hypothetical protein
VATDGYALRADLERLDALIRETLPDLEVHRRDDRVSSASRKTGISLYVLAMTDDGEYLAEARAAEFPKAAVRRACVRFKRLDDLDESALRSLLEEAGHLPAAGAA